jgi:hypothetical protein
MDLATARSRTALAMSEKTLQNHVGGLAADLRRYRQTYVLFHHTHISMHSSAGVPDCKFVNPRLIGTAATLYIELKRECRCKPNRARCPNHPSPDQQEWLDTLAAIGHPVYVLVPSDWESNRATRIITDFARGRLAA